MPNNIWTNHRTPPVPRRHEIDREGRPATDPRFQESAVDSDPRLSEWVGVGGVSLADRSGESDTRF